MPDRLAQLIWNSKKLIHLREALKEVWRKRVEFVQKSPQKHAIGISEYVTDKGINTLLPLFKFIQKNGKLPLS